MRYSTQAFCIDPAAPHDGRGVARKSNRGLHSISSVATACRDKVEGQSDLADPSTPSSQKGGSKCNR